MLGLIKEFIRKSNRALELSHTLPRINNHREKPIRFGRNVGPVETFAKLGVPPDCKTIFDVGANVGQFAIIANEYFYDPMVYCFEPVSSTFKELEAAVAEYSNIKTFKIGMFNRTGTSEINVTNFSPANSMIKTHQDYEQMFGKWVKEDGSKEEIQVMRLDDFVAENKIHKINLLKIDVEGVEYEVLEGGRDSLQKIVDRVYLEISLVRKGRGSSEFLRIYELLDSAGFALETFHCVDYKKVDWYERVSQFDALFTKREML